MPLGTATAGTLRVPGLPTDDGGVITFSSNTSNDIWIRWNAVYTGRATIISSNSAITPSSTISVTSNNDIWTIWNHAYAANNAITIGAGTAAAITPTVVAAAQIVTNPSNTIVWTHWIGQNELTREQRAEIQRQQQVANDRWRQQQTEIQQVQAKAQERAQRLLEESLDPKQREELAAKGYFELDVISSNGQRRRYRIHRKWSHSIHQIDPANGQRLKTLCIHPREQTPVEDSMLAQKLMLEGGMEEELLRIANHS